MKILATSDDTGAIKEIVCVRGTDTSKQDAPQPKSIKNICTEPNVSVGSKILYLVNFNSKYLIASRQGGSLCIYDLKDKVESEEEQYKLLHHYRLEVNESDRPISLIKFEKYDSVFIAYESGKVFIINFNNSLFDLGPILINLPGNKQISDFINNPYEDGIFAFGGKENDVKLIKLFEGDITTEIFIKNKENEFFKPTIIFTAKNVKNDHLDLRVPVWISKIRFFKEKPLNGYKFIAATRYGQLRIYDTTHGKRPVGDYKVCEKPILTLNFSDEKQNEVIISDTHNLIAKYSLIQIDQKAFKTNSATAGQITKPVARLLGKYSEGGNTGATVGIDIGNNEIIATGGLDRYLRVFDINSREILSKVYLGVEISDVVILCAENGDDEEDNKILEASDIKINIQKKRRRDIIEAEESDEENLWNQLESSNKDLRENKKNRKI